MFGSIFSSRDKNTTNARIKLDDRSTQTDIAVKAPGSFAGVKVLLVDDDPVTTKALTNLLESWGCAATSASEASEAISAVRQSRPDLILMDIQFPPDPALGGGWDGFQIMNWLWASKAVGGVPWIVVSASDNDACKKRALAQGAVAFCPKPINPGSLRGHVETALARSGRH